MEELKDKSIHHTTIKICEDLKKSASFISLFGDIQKLVVTPSVKSDDFKNTLLKAMQENGLESELKNSIYRWIKTKRKEVSPYDSFFRKAQIHWDKRIHKSLNSMCSELGISLAKTRGTSEREEILSKWTELTNFEVDINKYRPVYAPRDFLEVLINLRGPIRDKSQGDNAHWEFTQLPLRVKNLADLVRLGFSPVLHEADRLAREGSAMYPIGPEPILGVPYSMGVSAMKELLTQEFKNSWHATPGVRQAKTHIEGPSLKLTKCLLGINRRDIRMVTGLLTGHCHLSRHLQLIGIAEDPECRWCLEDEETSPHVLTECPAIARVRERHFGSSVLNPKDVKSIQLRKLCTFAKERSFYPELSRGEQILAANNSLSTTQAFTALEAERIDLGEKILAKNYAPLAQEFLKKGCPRCLRARMWSLLLGSEIKPQHTNYFEMLKEHVLQYDLMTDKLIIKDINLTASNDDQYFVFEDVLYQVMLCFSRDNDILKNLPNQPAFMQVVIKGKHNSVEKTMVFPPSGVIPFHGFSMYAAPFCYLFDKPDELYFVFRAFYLRYWHKLHRVCAGSQGIVSLCLLYEKLLQCHEPLLWNHFKKYHIHPLRLVIKWIMRAFSGHLPPEQLLTLWDLVLAYDSLEIIPLLAAIIIVFRKDNLLKVTTLQNIEAVLADLSSVAVIPLLQIALLKET
ncbi:hypothetical protein NQ317_011814 [Molorchus minor]|uniref:Rab-GAP TBC domain-containing protein n=1 Tax=Molorchus minor TaxID=1323400 RepID=A0ABQ9JG78_9CUCU|nr:hypothetical protein NQ317_011814 [Molorchus minor]